MYSFPVCVTDKNMLFTQKNKCIKIRLKSYRYPCYILKTIQTTSTILQTAHTVHKLCDNLKLGT